MTLRKAFLSVIAATLAVGVSGSASASDGRYCREYTRTVIVGGQHQEAYGTVCLAPNGDWEIVSAREDHRSADEVRFDHYQPRHVYREAPTKLIVVERESYFVPPGHLKKIGYRHPAYWKDHSDWRHHHRDRDRERDHDWKDHRRDRDRFEWR